MAKKAVVEKFLNTQQVADRYGVSPRHLRHLVNSRKFPPPLLVGNHAWRWSLAALLQWEQKGGVK